MNETNSIDPTPIQPGLAAAEAATAETPAETPAEKEAPTGPISVCSALTILNDNSPKPEEVWGGLTLETGSIMEIIGPSGLGKSRIALYLAICQILGRRFADLPVFGKPLNWLFYGNENSKFRFKTDLKKMATCSLKKEDGPMTEEELTLLDRHLFLPTMEKPEDFDLSLSSDENVEKLKNTILAVDADVVVFDPWGCIIAGDELSDKDVVDTLTTLKSALAVRKGKPTVGIILNHSLGGLKKMAEAYGAEANNYGKNSKKIFTIVRSVWNLRAGSFEESPKKIELINAKFSNDKKCERRAVDFNEATFHYTIDKNFNHDKFQAQIELAYEVGKRNAARQRQAESKTMKEAGDKEVIMAFFERQVQPVKREKLKEDCKKEHHIPFSVSERIRKELVKDGSLIVVSEGPNGFDRYYGTPEIASAFLAKNPTWCIVAPPLKTNLKGGVIPSF